MTSLIPTTAPSKILLLTDADVWAGTERHMLDLAIALRECGQQIAIAAPPQSRLREKCTQNELEFVPIEKNGLLDVQAVRTLISLLKERNFEIIHAHNGRTQLSAVLACALARRGATIFTQHFISPSHAQMSGPKAAIFGWVHRLVGKKTHRVVAISQAVRAAYLQRSPGAKPKTIVVPNGICDPQRSPLEDSHTVRARHGVSPQAPLVVCAARLETEKEIHVLIEAFDAARRSFPDAQLRIAGEGALRDELQQLIETKNLTKNVTLVGFLNDALSFFAASDIVVLPAPAEPFGLVFLEAMGLEKPVVACAGGAAPEIIVEGKTGLLVAPNQSVAMAQAIEHLLREPKLRQKMGCAGRERFQKFYMRDQMARATLTVYRSVTSRLPVSSEASLSSEAPAGDTVCEVSA